MISRGLSDSAEDQDGFAQGLKAFACPLDLRSGKGSGGLLLCTCFGFSFSENQLAVNLELTCNWQSSDLDSPHGSSSYPRGRRCQIFAFHFEYCEYIVLHYYGFKWQLKGLRLSLKLCELFKLPAIFNLVASSLQTSCRLT